MTLPKVVGVTVTGDTLSVDLDDGRTVAVPMCWYPRLEHGTPAERANVEIGGAGYGLHWPELDEDIGVAYFNWMMLPCGALRRKIITRSRTRVAP